MSDSNSANDNSATNDNSANDNSANDNRGFCACDECVNLAKKKYNGFFICTECLQYEIYIENGGLTTIPVDPESCETFDCVDDDKSFNDVQWLTGC